MGLRAELPWRRSSHGLPGSCWEPTRRRAMTAPLGPTGPAVALSPRCSRLPWASCSLATALATSLTRINGFLQVDELRPLLSLCGPSDRDDLGRCRRENL